MKKITVAASAAALMICGLFTGCGCAADESSLPNTSSTSSTTTTTTTKTTAGTESSSTTSTTVTTKDDNSLIGDVTDAVDSVVDDVTGALTDATKPVGTE